MYFFLKQTNKNKKSAFCFVLFSLIRIFASEYELKQ